METYDETFVTVLDPVATGQRASYDAAADCYVISGPCPRCDDPISDDAITMSTQLTEAPPSPGLATGSPPPPPVQVWTRVFLRSCDCDFAHKPQVGERPAGKRGCGAWWSLRVVQDLARATDPVVGTPETGDPQPTFRDQEAVEAALDASLTQVRGTAEKWRNALAGLAGLTGTFLVLKGVTDFAKAPDAITVAFCGLAGLICGASGAVVAAQAAIGTPSEFHPIGAGDAARMQVARLKLATAAAARLELAKGLTLAAFIFLLLAFAFTFTKAPKAEPMLQVTTSDREHPICGTPSAGARNTILIDRGDGDTVEIAVRSITSMTVVTSCDE